ncbi:hypothetical protein LINGRAHAP2_LOCUS6046 [Linum grandiflorum]
MSSSSSITVSTAAPSNLICFLHSVTPVPLSKSSIRDLNRPLQPLQNESEIDYFTLADLWSCYEEFSAYGAETTVLLNGDDYVTQYYAPYLSGIQLYTNKPFSASSGGHDDALEVEKDTTDGDKHGSPYLLFIESCSPNYRVPLWKKVANLAIENPGLMTLTSADLSPASWMSVAWYPIYHIPTKREKDLDTVFLTFHMLSSSFQGADNVINDACVDAARAATRTKVIRDDGNVGIPLPPFGLSTLKMRGDLWIADGDDFETLDNLDNAADSWLKQLGVSHHDFNFFKRKFAESM